MLPYYARGRKRVAAWSTTAPRARSYGGTKRRRTTYRRTAIRYKKRRYARRGRNMPLYKPVRMGLNQPVRMFVTHTNVLSTTVSNTSGQFSTLVKFFLPLRLRDFDAAVANERYPMNYTDYARMFSNYRVHGIKITAYFGDMDNDSNDQFVSTYYSVPGPNDGTQPSDPYSVLSADTVNAIMQEKGLRKQLVIGNGANNKPGMTVHNSGYWSMKRIQSDLTHDAHISEGEVAVDGSAVSDPELKPLIIHKLIAMPNAGFGATHNFSIRYKITAYVEWFARRRVFEGVRTEV